MFLISEEYKKLSIKEKMAFLLGLEEKTAIYTTERVKALLLQNKKLEDTMDKKIEETKVSETPEVKKEVEIVKVENGEREMTLQEIIVLGEQLYKARCFADIQNSAQVVAKILKGREIGIGAMASLEKIFVVGGKTAIQAELMADMIKRSGKYNYRILLLDNTACEIEFFEEGKSVGKSKFTLDDAKRAGVSGGMNWQKYPRNMLFARALSNGGRWYCPDAIHSCYTPDELNLFTDETGAVIQSVPDFQIEGMTKVEPKVVEAEIVKPDVKDEKKEDKSKIRKDEFEKLKEKYGEAKLKVIKKSLEIKGKLLEVVDEEWAMFVKEVKKTED